MFNDKQTFQLRCSILYCFQSFLYKNELGQSQIIQTLLPSAAESESRRDWHGGGDSDSDDDNVGGDDSDDDVGDDDDDDDDDDGGDSDDDDDDGGDVGDDDDGILLLVITPETPNPRTRWLCLLLSWV